MSVAAPPRRVSNASIEFAPVAGRTAVVAARAESPLKLLFPRHAGTSAWACASSLGGGLVDGDALSLEAVVREGSRAALTTQASTKVYRGTAAQRLTARVEDGGVLVAAPDPVACFEGARYRQEQRFSLDDGASLAVIDWLTSGRAARGERWRFASYESRLRVERGGKLELLDATLLDDGLGLGRFDLLGLAAVTGPAFAGGARTLIEEESRAQASRLAPLILSASPFGQDGVLLRFAAESIEDAARALRARLRFVWDVLGDDPWSRRY